MVLHLFCSAAKEIKIPIISKAIDKVKKEDGQVVTASILGHKADIMFMLLVHNPQILRDFQTQIAQAGLSIKYSYVSITEVSEYASGVPEEMKQARLYPQLPPDEKPILGFYPMSKKRGETHNWFSLPYEERSALMREHGSSGRNFAGRVLQVITGSTGLDDYEWGVTLFCSTPADLKDVVYSLRFDEASAKYADFGPFFFGLMGDSKKILNSLPKLKEPKLET